MSLIEPDHIPQPFEVNILASDYTHSSRGAFRTDKPLYFGGKTLIEFRALIDRLLKRELTETQLEATFLYFTHPKNTYASVYKALECNRHTVTHAVKKSINLVKNIEEI